MNAQIIKDTRHEGRPIIRDKKGGVLVLCPIGHFYHFIPMKEWARSIWEAHLGSPKFTVKCSGAIQKPTRS